MQRRRFAWVALAVLALGCCFLSGATSSRGSADFSPLELQVFGQRSLLSDSPFSLRMVVRDHFKDQPLEGADVGVVLEKPETNEATTLWVGKTDERGTASPSMSIPDLPEGNYQLAAVTWGRYGFDRISLPVTIEKGIRLLLVTDKPMYQPRQTIHIRALALRQPNLKAEADSPITIEVMDSKGNKVFKKSAKTSEFGVLGADFNLADEINLGSYKIRATLGKTTEEKTVEVKRYVLPKFKVSLETDKPYYLPLETVRGTVRADYFFGKPVSDARVNVKVSTFDVGFNEIENVQGRSNAVGVFEFSFKLPESFVGLPLEQGNAFVQFEVSVVDQADHKEQITEQRTVAAQPIRITIIPESGEIVSGTENLLYVVTTYPDGTPANCRVDGLPPRAVASLSYIETGELGIGRGGIILTADAVQKPLTFRVSATDTQGHRAEVEYTPTVSSEADGILLRTSEALYKVGDEMRLTAFSPTKKGTVYFDVIKDRQTMLTQAAELKDGWAKTAVSLAPDLTGTIEVHAYCIRPDGNIVRDTKIVYVSSADDLSIEVKADKDTYLPGGKANLSFQVTDPKGHPVLAALGISVVDEAVFALQEMQPGLEKVFFTLEKELLEPRYEIHGYDPGYIIQPMLREETSAEQEIARKKEAAKVLFAAAEPMTEFTLKADSYAARAEEMKKEWAEQMAPNIKKIGEAVERWSKEKRTGPEADKGLQPFVAAGYLKEDDIVDTWGNELRVLAYEWTQFPWREVQSAGPDGRFDTVDDIALIEILVQTDDEIQREFGAFRWAEGEFADGGIRMFPGGVRYDLGVPMPAWAKKAEGQVESVSTAPLAGAEPPRIRKFFPETLYWNPALITDEKGRAVLPLDMADSITTWRLTALASSKLGQLGSTTAPLRVFQDFFIDIDLPVALTQGDEVSVPIAVYNYLPGRQKVRLKAEAADWFESLGASTAELDIASNDVDVVYFPIKAVKNGYFKFLVYGYGEKMSDAIEREVRIEPNGQEILESINDRLEGDVTKTVTIPEAAIDGASNILVKVYPGIFSQVVEGLDKILQMPFGCFEQTSSTTYPNVLVLDYMKSSGQANPEVQMKAEGYINLGYQRLLSYEVQGGGFSWFGDAPANKVLTAYGLLEFHDMARVYEIDEDVITRTQQWLLAQQESDGSWSPDKAYLHEESWGRIQNTNMLPTAYVTWALAESGFKGGQLDSAVGYLAEHLDEAKEAYTLAIACNALVAVDKNSDPAQKALGRLVDMKVEEDGKVHWPAGLSTITHSTGEGADVEATALAAYALIKSGRYTGIVTEALTWLIQAKSPNGIWPSTQATVVALKALLGATGSATQEINAEVSVLINGEVAGGFALTPENSDVLQQVDLKQFVREGENEIQLRFAGKGSSLYQIVTRYYLPWSKPPVEEKLLSIDVKYDRSQLAKDDLVTCSVTIANNRPGSAKMVIVDLGIPPGFEVQTGDLDELLGSQVFQKYSLTGRQIIIYLEEVENGNPITFSYRLRAKFPIRAMTPQSRVYEYYNPKVEDVARPVEMEVKS